MSKIFKLILITCVILLLVPFAFDTLTVRTLDWKDVQRYGGIKVDQPIVTENGYYLPIICNVSGFDSVTVKPIALSSINICKRTKIKIKDQEIYLSVKVSEPYFDDDICNCKAVKIGKLNHGHYKVFYDSGEFIGEFDL